MGKAIASLVPLIYLADCGRRLKASSGFGVDRFLNQFVPAIEFSTIVLSRLSLAA